MANFFRKWWSVPVALLVAIFLADGLLIPFLNFYWDDLPYLWSYHVNGGAGFPAFLASDRPLSAWVYMLLTPLFGEQPIGYHIFILLAIWVGAAAFWAILRLAWPRHPRLAACGAILFAVYPGFTQTPVAVAYSLHFTVLALFLLSLVGSLLAIKRPRLGWPLTFAALLFSAVHFSLEYYFTLEFLRPVLIWLALAPEGLGRRARVKQVMLRWAPYMGVLALFIFWRVWIFKFPTYQPVLVNQVDSSFARGWHDLTSIVPLDMATVGLLAWFQPLASLPGMGVQTGLAVAGVTLASFLLAVFFLFFFIRANPGPAGGQEKPVMGWQAVMVGLLALFLAGWPAWITGLPVTLIFPLDRLTLPFMFGSALLWAGLVELIPRRAQLARPILIGLLVGVAVGWQFYNANTYRKDWQAMREFFWQLSWRIPGLKPGTSLLTNNFPLRYYSDNSLVAMVNRVYAPDFKGVAMPYTLFYIDQRIYGKIPALAPGLILDYQYRSFHFSSTTDQSLVVIYDPPRCLRVIDPGIDLTDSRLSEIIRAAAPISHLDQIQTGPVQGPSLPASLLGEQPSAGWCYYFERAELARQVGDWQAVVRSADAAYDQPDPPKDAWEELVFIEGYARAGKFNRAETLSQAVLERDQSVQAGVCAAWQRTSSTIELPARESIPPVQIRLGCSDP